MTLLDIIVAFIAFVCIVAFGIAMLVLRGWLVLLVLFALFPHMTVLTYDVRTVVLLACLLAFTTGSVSTSTKEKD